MVLPSVAWPRVHVALKRGRQNQLVRRWRLTFYFLALAQPRGCLVALSVSVLRWGVFFFVVVETE